MISQKIKTLRKQAKMSQEQLAEKLGVSRQAVTKWETGAGIPDIENIKAVSLLFNVSLDELLENECNSATKQDFLFNSSTEYDIDSKKGYDINFSGAKEVKLVGYEGEKVLVRLSSNIISEIQTAFKVKIDDNRRGIDIDINSFGDMTETRAKEGLCITIRVPQKYVGNIELTGNTQTLYIGNLESDNMEFSGKIVSAVLDGVVGHVELNSNEDMQIICGSLGGRLDINQISATSKLTVPKGAVFSTITRGIANKILFEKNGVSVEDFSLRGEEAKGCENIIELNGMKSELIITTN